MVRNEGGGLPLFAGWRWQHLFRVWRSRRHQPRKWGYVVRRHPYTGQEYLNHERLLGREWIAFRDMGEQQQERFLRWRRRTYHW